MVQLMTVQSLFMNSFSRRGEINVTVVDYLRKSAEQYPDKAAFSDQEKAVSYGKVLSSAEKIATVLIQRFGAENSPIAVLIDRNVESVCGFLGIAMSRNFYVPIDVTLPVQRVRAILEQMQPVAIIAATEVPNELTACCSIPIMKYEEFQHADADPMKLEKVRISCLDTDPLYAICTSGTTGTPKGVLISHRSVLDFIPAFCKTFSFDEGEVFGNQAPFDFDVSVKDIYSTLYCGASMYIMPKVCFSMPKLLVETLDEIKITTIIWAVSALCIAAGVNAFKHKVPQALRKILFSGEAMPVRMLNIWRYYFPDALFVNLYGPTEITCNCLYYILDREFAETEKLPLGVPFPNKGVLFLNEQNEPIQPGGTGEICVTGTCLALGYYRDPERTAAVFVQNPRNDRYPELMYRTGDLAELGEDGEYYFTARKDFQIKHMGHRIELEEIETYLNAIDGIIRASCLFDEKRNKIVACYAGERDKTEIITCLKENLPKHMIPNVFLRLEELPINKNGKIDRQALKEIYLEKR